MARWIGTEGRWTRCFVDHHPYELEQRQCRRVSYVCQPPRITFQHARPCALADQLIIRTFWCRKSTSEEVRTASMALGGVDGWREKLQVRVYELGIGTGRVLLALAAGTAGPEAVALGSISRQLCIREENPIAKQVN